MKQVSLLAPIQHVSFIQNFQSKIDESNVSHHLNSFNEINHSILHSQPSLLVYTVGNCIFVQNEKKFNKIELESQYCTSIKGIYEEFVSFDSKSLNIFTKENKENIRNNFERGSINEINRSKLWIFGGKYLGVLHFNTKEIEECKLQTIFSGNGRDWIMELKVFGDYLVLGYPHNCIEIFKIHHKENNFTTILPLKFVTGPRKSLLYSMSIIIREKNNTKDSLNIEESKDTQIDKNHNILSNSMHSYQDNIDPFASSNVDLLIASGTIFGQVCIWNSTGEELAFLKGHEGSIFSINWNDTKDAVATTSDDRTVRYWKLKWSLDNANKSSIELEYLKTYFGHASRVWYSIFHNEYIISAGEDATIRFWNIQSENCVYILKGHSVKSIWKICVSPDGKWLVSGGGDSSVKTWPLDDILETINLFYNFNIEIPITSTKEMIRGIQYNKNENQVPITFVATSSGNIYSVSPKQNLRSVYQHSKYVNDILRFILSPCNEYAAIVSSTGECHIIKISSSEIICTFQLLTKSKPLDVYWFIFNGVHHIFAPIFDGTLYHYISKDNFESKPQFLREYSLPTTVSYLLFKPELNLLICGDKNGNVRLLNANPEKLSNEVELNNSKPYFSMRKLHQKEKIVSLTIQQNRLYTMSVDGVLWILRLELQLDGTYILIKENLFRLFNIIPHIEHMYISSITGDIIVSGFHSTYFIVYNLTQRSRIACIDTGGHRRIHNIFYDDNSGYSISYSIGEKLYIYHQPKPKSPHSYLNNQTIMNNYLEPYSTIHGQFHGRSTYSVHSISKNTNNLDSILYITGSEDCSLLITELSYKSELNKFICQHSLEIHESPTRCIASCSRNSPNSFIMISGGGKEELSIYTLRLKENTNHPSINDHIRKMNESQMRQHLFYENNYVEVTLHYFDSLTDQFLHLFHPELVMSNSLVDDIKYRIMSIAIFPVYNISFKELYVIAVGGSDAKLKIFLWDMETLIPVAVSSSHRGVIKKMKSVLTNDGKYLLITTATDSLIQYYDITNILEKAIVNLKDGAYSDLRISESFCPSPEYNPRKSTRKAKKLAKLNIISDNSNESTKLQENELNNSKKTRLNSDTEIKERKRIKLDIMELKPLQIYEKMHQNGINSLHVHYDQASNLLYIITGSDDQSVCLLKIQINQNGNITSYYQMKEAHTSTVTGVYTDGLIAISTSTDQRVVSYDIIENQLKIREATVTCIADPMDMNVIKVQSNSSSIANLNDKISDNDVCYRISIVGDGMEIIDFKH